MAADAKTGTCEIGQAVGKGTRSPETELLGSAIVIDGVKFPASCQVIPEFTLHTDTSSYATLVVGRIVNNGVTPAQNARVVFGAFDLQPGTSLNILDIQKLNQKGPGQNCFARGTMIETPYGAMPIEQLEDGDEVLTHDGETQLISWIGQRRLSGLELVLDPSLRPVRIMAGALTGGRPGQDLLVSQNHRLLVDDWRAPFLYGEEEILTTAKSLLNNNNVYIDCPVSGIDYYHLLMDDHQLVCANGLWAETMLAEASTLEMLTPDQRTSVESMQASGQGGPGKPCRTAAPALPYWATEALVA
ncbi:MAG: Hint domain-containing protein [Paracoccaceae bacterium]